MDDWWFRIKSYEEWSSNPSYHGGYDDYVRHMKGLKEYFNKEKGQK